MSINDLNLGDKAYIEDICGNDKLCKRLLALGCTKGTEIEFKNTAPFGDPIVINFRGFDLALRKKDAKNIHVNLKERLEAAYDNCCTSR
ncbi:FeoA family protein [uncultured Clostridium sp.]|uniref:FeoA family protein n=1 Tax=uncultured Clostridium sp. TaxID=59620 RepID=UPI0028ECF7AD|nr:FeoA family protein [uncultured Clostridium sp.]